MGGGNDLNLKKSWHPQLMTNQRRVYDAEQAALQERKVTEARIEEIRRERQIEETQRQLEATGGPKRVDRVDWMYQGPNDGGRDEFSSEAFLLGKRRIDSILRGDDAKTLERPAGPTGSAGAPVPIVASARDTAAKIREDPLVAIKRQEQEAYQAMMKDPSRRRQLLAQMGMAEEEPKKHKDERHRSRRHRSYRDRDDRDRRRRRDDSRDRSRSPRRYDDDSSSEYERDQRSRRSDSRERAKERPRYGSRDRRESRRRDYADINPRESRRREDSGDEGKESRRRDYSYDQRRESRRKDHAYDERKESHRRDYSDRRRTNNAREERSRKWDVSSRDSAGAQRNGDDEEEKARRLAAMQSDATDLDKARQARLAALAEREQAERETDDRARAKSHRYGGRDFANRLHNSAGNESLADRLGRGRQGLQREDA